ncbi:hypothetical protein YC2023_060880 [Brassica napus]
MESTSRGGETYEEASKRNRRNSQELKSEDKPSFKIRSKRFSVYKRRRKTVGRSSLQLHKFMEEGFTRLRVTHKIIWWQATSIRKKGVGAVLDLQSQGVCDYMHWSLGSLHVLQVIGTESIVEQKGFSHWFSMRLSQDLVRVFTVFLRAIYMVYQLQVVF